MTKKPESKAAFIRRYRHMPNVELAALAETNVGYVRIVRQRTSEEGKPKASLAERNFLKRHWKKVKKRKAKIMQAYYRENAERIKQYNRDRYHGTLEVAVSAA